MKANKTTRGQAVSNHRSRKDKESESSIDSAAHNLAIKQTNKQKRTTKWQESPITKYLSILTLNVKGLNFTIKRHHLANWIKK
jgi:hypothetical protein